jgi:simple sugar transport system permease protein
VNAILDFAPPLVFTALGGVLSERAGVINIGLEGMMRFGAFAAAACAIWTGSPWMGLAGGALAGAMAAAVHAFLSLRFRADQVVSGIALNLVALGLVTWLLQAAFGSSGVSPEAPSLPRDRFGHTALSYAALIAPIVLGLWLAYTPSGLHVRAAGENARAAATSGVRVVRLRAVCVVFGGALAGIGGAALSIGILGQFDSRMPAGLGFVALAAVVFGKWTPAGAGAAAFFFAAADALQRQLSFGLHAADLRLEGIFLALPYALTLLVLALGLGRTRAPAESGVPYDPEAR